MADWQQTLRIIVRYILVGFVSLSVLSIVYCFVKDVFISNKGRRKGKKMVFGRFR